MTVKARTVPGPVVRSALFLCVGLMNTVWIRPEDLYSLKHHVGLALLAWGLVEGSVLLVQSILRARTRAGRG